MSSWGALFSDKLKCSGSRKWLTVASRVEQTLLQLVVAWTYACIWNDFYLLQIAVWIGTLKHDDELIHLKFARSMLFWDNPTWCTPHTAFGPALYRSGLIRVRQVRWGVVLIIAPWQLGLSCWKNRTLLIPGIESDTCLGYGIKRTTFQMIAVAAWWSHCFLTFFSREVRFVECLSALLSACFFSIKPDPTFLSCDHLQPFGLGLREHVISDCSSLVNHWGEHIPPQLQPFNENLMLIHWVLETYYETNQWIYIYIYIHIYIHIYIYVK